MKKLLTTMAVAATLTFAAHAVEATYINADGNEQTVDAVVVPSSTTTFTDGGWYVVNANTTINTGTLTVPSSGSANLILADGVTLTVTGPSHSPGVLVPLGSTLSIYGQSAGTGELVATGGSKGAGIGAGGGSSGVSGDSCGTVKIYGGRITANGTNRAAGIGGGGGGSNRGDTGGNGGTIEVYGGIVTATGNSTSGIGGGTSGSSNPGSNGSLKVAKGMVVKAGSNEAGATELTPDAETGMVTLSSQTYFYIEAPTALTQTVSNLGEVEQGAEQSWNLADTLEGNVKPYVFSGDVPAGFTFADGVLTLGEAAGGVYNITLTAAGSAAPRLSKPVEFTWTVTVLSAPKTITYMDGEKTLDLAPASYRPGIGVTLAESAAKTGYAFAGWYDNAELTGEAVAAVGTDATEDLIFYAKWTATPYSIVYMDGSTPLNLAPASYTIEAAVTLPAATKDDKDFVGWYTTSGFTGDAVTEIALGSTGAKTFYAKFVPSRTPATYIDADGVEQTAPLCITIDDADPETYAFEDNGWYVVKSDAEFHSTLTVNGSVNLILADGAKLTVTATGSSYMPGIHVASGNTLNIYAQSEGTGALEATGAANGAGIGGQGANSRTIEACGNVNIYGGQITAKGGTNAAGIGGGGNAATSGTTRPGGNGGTVKVYGGTVTANGGAANAAGIGAGYGRSAASSQGTLTVATGMVVKVGASANPTASPTINANGEVTLSGSNSRYFTITEPGALVQSESALENGVESIPDEWDLAASISGGVPGYTFAGELPEGFELTAAGVLSTLATAKAGDYSITVTVTDSSAGRLRKSVEFTWTVTILNAPKTITYMDGEEPLTGLEPTQYNPGVAASLPATATKDGYDLVAWYDNPELAGDPVTEVATTETDDLTFYAGWTAHEYSITYMDGNTALTGLAPASYTIEDEVALPATAEKTGYGFYGWFDNAATTGDEVTEIPAGTTGDKTFYAKWGNPWVAATYIGADGKEATAKSVVVTTSTTTFEDGGWYVVNGNVTTGSITVNGTANLILADGATLTATGPSHSPGVLVLVDNTLNIYAQSAGTGALAATGGSKGAGIGGGGGSSGSSGQSCGTVNIYGGHITANGTNRASGIGGGGGGSNTGDVGGNGGEVYVYGGYVTATGDTAAGIGGGGSGSNHGGSGGTFVNYGGTVVATRGTTNDSDIGAANGGSGATFTVFGGSTVLANSSATATPTDGKATVYCVTVPSLARSTKYVFDGLGTYGQANIVSDEGGNVYLWLPNGEYSFAETATYAHYTATVASDATTATKSGDQPITDNSDDHTPVGYMDGTTAVILETTEAGITIPETAETIDIVISGNEATLSSTAEITLANVTVRASDEKGVKQQGTDVTGAFKVTPGEGSYVIELDPTATVTVDDKKVKVEPQIDTAYFPPIGVVGEDVDFAVATIPGLWYGILTCDTPNGVFAVGPESVMQAEDSTSHVTLPIGTESVMFYKVRIAPSKAGVEAAE